MTIPRTLHRIVLPPMQDEGYVRDHWDRFRDLHPDWTLKTWTSIDDSAHRDLLKRCRTAAQQADILRLEVLDREGGVYVDTDCEPIRPLDDLLSDPNECFLGTENGEFISIGVIGATPHHPAIRAYLDAAVGGFDRSLPPNFTTGPFLATRILSPRSDVTVHPPVAFYPEPWADRANATRRPASDFPESYVVHRWAMTWHRDPTIVDRVRGRALGLIRSRRR